MPAFKKFGPGDQVDNVLVLEPRYDLASGALGWHGSPEGSASLNLYGGARRSAAHVVTRIEYQSLYPGINQAGKPSRGLPLTASVQRVYVTDEPLSPSSRTSERWGEEHFSTVMRLFEDYYHMDPDFVTGTYDYYSVYFNRDSTNIVGFNGPMRNASSLVFPSGSWALEAWVKPFATASLTNDFTIASMNRTFWLGVTGSTGRLTFSSSLGAFTASAGPTVDRWSHVAVLYDSATQTGSFRINLIDVGTFGHAALTPPASFTGSFTIGQRWSGTLDANREICDGAQGGSSFTGLPRRSWHGLIGETRFWFVKRTDAQLSSSWDGSLVGRAASGTFYTVRFVEGPLATFGSSELINVPADGSGTLNQPAMSAPFSTGEFTQRVQQGFGYLKGFGDRTGPTWVPSDNVTFCPPKALVAPQLTSSLMENIIADSLPNHLGDGPPLGISVLPMQRMVVIDVPAAFYGREISRNSLVLTCRAYSSGSHGLVRTLIDDGRGGLFISGSVCSGSSESYRGVEWNKVGNVFYGEGLIVIKEPSLLDFGAVDGASSHPNDTLQLTFRGTTHLPVKTLMCRIDRGEFNCSANPTFSEAEEDGIRVRSQPSGSLRVTTVGIYNEDRELVGVARLADPLRVRDRDRLNIKLRMDF